VTFGVSLVGLMYRRAPADFQPIERAVHATCPAVGTGRWVDSRGGVVDGPAAGAPAGAEARGARRQRHRPPGTAPDATRVRARGRRLRLASGVAGLGLGIPLVLAAPSAEVAGPVGVVCCLVGASALAALLPGR
jgi:hypothetical protein